MTWIIIYLHGNQSGHLKFKASRFNLFAYTCTCGRLTRQYTALKLEEYFLRRYATSRLRASNTQRSIYAQEPSLHG